MTQNKLTAAELEAARSAGRAYGEQEAELLADQGIDPTARTWIPDNSNATVPDDVSDAAAWLEAYDNAARDAFDAFDLDEYRARNPHATI